MIRDDLSTKLIHLTRGDEYGDAANRFLNIIYNTHIAGGNNSIRGGYRCVCFSEAPISKLAQVLSLSLDIPQGRMRYRPFGVMIDKRWLFAAGGRPVIYQPEAEYDQLPETHKYRHVRYEPPHIDWTWERECRIRTDRLDLDSNTTTFLVPDRRWEEWFLEQHFRAVADNSALLGIPIPDPVPWHFLVLSDLGVEIPNVSAPT